MLAVKVRNQLPSSRWYSGSGIYRDVHLVVTDPVHVARHGTFVTTPDLASTFKPRLADVHVRDRRRRGGAARPSSVVSTVTDAAGRTRRPASTARRPPDRHDRDQRRARRASRTLWSTDDPYLYTLDDRAPRGGARPSTAPTTTFGIR